MRYRAGSSKPPGPPPTPAERWFRLGADLARVGRFKEALEPLEQALAYAVEDRDRAFLREMRSFYGMTIALIRGEIARGRRLCEEAILGGSRDPQLFVNLAQVYFRADRRDLAVETLRSALALDAAHHGARTLMAQLGARRAPVFTFLPRAHPINKVAGKLRHKLRPRQLHL